MVGNYYICYRLYMLDISFIRRHRKREVIKLMQQCSQTKFITVNSLFTNDIVRSCLSFNL